MRKYTYSSTYPQEQQQESYPDRVLVKKMLGYLAPYTWPIVLAILLLFAAKVIEAYVPLVIGEYSQTILNATSTTLPIQKLAVGTAWIIAALVLASLFETANIIVKNWIGQKALYKLRNDVFEHIQQLPVEYFDKNAVGRLMTRTIHDVDQINLMFSDSIIPLIGSIFLFIGVSIGVIVLNTHLAIAFFVTLPILCVIANRFRKGQRKTYGKIRAIVSAMNTFIQEHLTGVSTIRLFSLKSNEKSKFEKINNDYKTGYVESGNHFAELFAGIDLIQSLALILVFVLLVLSPQGFQGGEFFTFSLYVIMIFRPIGDLAERYNVLQSAVAASSRIFHILSIPIEVSTPSKKTIATVESISFENVWFAYDGQEWVIKDLSFEVKKGQTAALVGITGAGKTTITSLLLRYYEIQKGSIKINGTDIREYSLATLRSCMSVVLQDPVIFSGSFSDNVSLNASKISEKQINQALDDANMEPIVRRYPQGRKHFIAERGTGLSTGEKQLLSLARAIAHNRDILILDEATANIDAYTERAIQEALHRLLSSKTSIVIAHRLSTIQHADKILVMHQGELKEEGTHAQLLKSKGIYEKLYRLQFNGEVK